jgi:hypothetical protein
MESPSAKLFLYHHPLPARRESQIRGGVTAYRLAESGFGGWADEKIKTAREVAPLLSLEYFQNEPETLELSRQI